MGNSYENHQKWYLLCPGLPFSLCSNLIVTFLFIVFLPVIITVGPLLATIIGVGCVSPYELTRYGSMGCKENYCVRVLIHLLFFFILMPLAVALVAIVMAIVDVIAIIPLYYYSIAHFVRLCVVSCRSKL